jgi:hypothetical protein
MQAPAWCPGKRSYRPAATAGHPGILHLRCRDLCRVTMMRRSFQPHRQRRPPGGKVTEVSVRCSRVENGLSSRWG